MSSPSKEPAQATARSPLAGCAILITVGLVVIFLIVFSIISFFRQADEIAKFTAEKPVPIEVTNVTGRENDLSALAARLSQFQTGLAGDQPAVLALSADDLNLAIAAYEPFQDLRGTFRIREISDKDMHIDVSYKLNGKPRPTREGEGGMITTDFRYLNATWIARPLLEQNEVALRIDQVLVPGKDVPKEFVIRLSPYQVMQRYRDHPVIGPVMKKLTRVEIAEGNLILKRTPGETQTDAISNSQVDSASSRLFTIFGIVATVFLLFVALMIFMSLRSKKQGA